MHRLFSIGRIFSLIWITVVILLTTITLSNLYSNHPTTRRRYASLLGRHMRGGLVQKSLPLLSQSAMDGVETFLFFIGYPRSGHSIVGTLLDAHPNAVVAHEFNLFAKLFQPEVLVQLLNRTTLYNALYQNSVRQARMGWRSDNEHFGRKGYSLNLSLSTSFQGRFDELRIIGDKSGAVTAHCFKANPALFSDVYRKVLNSIQVPVKIMHVVRNPYDMIATRLLYRISNVKGKKANFSAQNPITNTNHVMKAIKALEAEASAVDSFMKQFKGLNILEIHNEELIQNTAGTMSTVCAFLDLECSKSYLQMCDDKVYDVPSLSRAAVLWDKSTNKAVGRLIRHYPHFKQYTLDG